MKILNQTIIGLLVNKMYRILINSGLDLTQQAQVKSTKTLNFS